MPIAIAPTGSAGLTWHEGEFALLREEIDRVLTLPGCRNIAALNRDYLALPGAHELFAGRGPDAYGEIARV